METAALRARRTLSTIAVLFLIPLLVFFAVKLLFGVFGASPADLLPDDDPLVSSSTPVSGVAREVEELLQAIGETANAAAAYAEKAGVECNCEDEGLADLQTRFLQLISRFFQTLCHVLQAAVWPAAVFAALWALDRMSERLQYVIGGAIEKFAWVVFVAVTYPIGAAMAAVLSEPWQMVKPVGAQAVAAALAALDEMGPPLEVILVMLIGGFGGLLVLIVAILLWRWFIDETARLQEWLLSLLTMKTVHPSFRRYPLKKARERAKERRDNITAFLANGTLPTPRTEYVMAPGDRRKFREHVVRRQVEEEGPPKLVNQFLEFPEGSPMVLKQTCLPEGPEEAVGQFVRLSFELKDPSPRSCWARLIAPERPEEIIVPLLARVVDAAILADLHADGQRREADWNGMPFYERIYAEWTPLPFPFKYLLRPVIGDAMPARVVIETDYEDVFIHAMPSATDWFGIGIEFRKPQRTRRRWNGRKVILPPRKSWMGTDVQPLCRRLKSHVPSVVSGAIDVRFASAVPADAPAGTLPGERRDTYHIMPSGPLADGCPSVVRPAPYPPLVPPPMHPNAPPPAPLPAEFERVKTPLPPRGTVSNAPPAWLFPANRGRFADCRLNCLRPEPSKPPEEIDVVQTRIGSIARPPGLLPRHLRGPKGTWLRRRIWSGAFFDNDLRIANRFPLFGCSSVLDLRGGFAHMTFVEQAFRWLCGWPRNTFRGVFVSASGPEQAANLLLPEPLLNDYLNHLAQRADVLQRMNECKGPPFVPKPAEKSTR